MSGAQEPLKPWISCITAEALETAVSYRLADMEVVMHFDDPKLDVCLPVNWSSERRLAR